LSWSAVNEMPLGEAALGKEVGWRREPTPAFAGEDGMKPSLNRRDASGTLLDPVLFHWAQGTVPPSEARGCMLDMGRRVRDSVPTSERPGHLPDTGRGELPLLLLLPSGDATPSIEDPWMLPLRAAGLADLSMLLMLDVCAEGLVVSRERPRDRGLAGGVVTDASAG
jgi:hypothetical protein